MCLLFIYIFFFNDTATTEIYTLSLHDALPISFLRSLKARGLGGTQLVISDAHTGLKQAIAAVLLGAAWQRCRVHFMRNRSEEHTSELQSRQSRMPSSA